MAVFTGAMRHLREFNDPGSMTVQKMPEYPQTVNLVPYGLPQFLDFEARPEKIRRIQGTFREEVTPGTDKDRYRLVELTIDPEEGTLLTPEGTEYNGEDYYTISPEKHFGPWLGQWVPVPFLRQSGDTHEDGSPRFRQGPVNWARAYVTRVPSEDNPDILSWRVVLAFDMQVEDQQGDSHVALTQDDVSARAICSLADNARDNSWFLNEGWVNAWLESLWNSYFSQKQNLRGRPRTQNGLENHVDYLASYSVFLRVLQAAIQNRSVRILNISGGQDKPSDPNATETVDVDLILDIGNSRTTGILVENILGRNTDLNDSYLLTLRDLSHPENFYTDPFETRVEFSRADFGSQAFSKRSGRKTNAFSWVSPVRTGFEAVNLANMSANAGGSSGMSSPKRYLWDQEDASNLWFFNRASGQDREELVSSNPICRFVNNSGTMISAVRELNDEGAPRKSYLSKLFNATLPDCRKQDALPANQPRFSRSSMMMFLLLELIQQALVTINSPGQRYSRQFHDRPRRLRSVIFTVPAGMSFAEQRIYRRWAHAAVNLLWDALGWKKHFYVDPQDARAIKNDSLRQLSRDYRMSPEIRSRWDEATCTQLVYLYNEISHNFQGDAHLFFETMGRKRMVPMESRPAETEEKPTLRVATVDIGGGTTDLSVITYVLGNDKSSTNRIWPKQEIRDGANLGGDDVLRTVIMEVVLTEIEKQMREQGISQATAAGIIRQMFGKKSEKISIQNQRIQFLRLIAMPIAYYILDEYEKFSLSSTGGDISVSLSELFPARGEGRDVATRMIDDSIKFFNDQVYEASGHKFDLRKLVLTFPGDEVDKIIGNSVRRMLNNMGELIYAYDCDVLLVSGRPSCWNAVIRQFYQMLPVAPDRVVPMREYQVGVWYPFANAEGKISDPKTTVVTGAILCILSENSIEGFVFDSSKLELKSTARFIGQMDVQGTLPSEMVWFPNTNPDRKRGETEDIKVVQFSAPITIGYRQIEAGRWSATRCWRMEFASEEAQHKAQGHTPYEVKVEFVRPEQDEGLEDIPESDRDIRAKLDEPRIDYTDPEAVQGRKMSGGMEELVPVPGKPVDIKLRTLAKQEEDGCWMDTAVLY